MHLLCCKTRRKKDVYKRQVKPASPEELIANAKRTIQGRHRVVLLAHDIVHSTASCLDDLIDQLQDYQMEPLTWDTKPIQFR